MIKRFIIILFSVFIIVAVIFNSNFVLRKLFANKVWAHKVNSIEQLHKAIKKFKGVEFDVVFYKNKEDVFFDINHPPDSSTNLSLTEYFQSQHTTTAYKYWIDFKNLKHENEYLASLKLNAIATEFNIDKNNIIVESTSPSCLELFKEKGFYTSYYIPSNLHTLDSIELQSAIIKINKNISLYDNIYISAEYKDFPILKKYYPAKKKIFWFTVYGSMNKIKARILLYKILLDSNVDILLIPND
jgi:hypothetical protein